MQPNDLPVVCLPLELADESAAALIEFLYELTEALERQYAGQLLRHRHSQCDLSPSSDVPKTPATEPPF
jgi:hypothetical protein